MNSKRKGNAGERELLHLLENHGLTVRRNDQRYTGGMDNPDLSCTVDGMSIHIECKRTEKLSLYEAMNQAERDANGHALPVVVHRRSRKPWLVVIKLDDLLKIVGKEMEKSRGAKGENQNQSGRGSTGHPQQGCGWRNGHHESRSSLGTAERIP